MASKAFTLTMKINYTDFISTGINLSEGKKKELDQPKRTELYWILENDKTFKHLTVYWLS